MANLGSGLRQRRRTASSRRRKCDGGTTLYRALYGRMYRSRAAASIPPRCRPTSARSTAFPPRRPKVTPPLSRSPSPRPLPQRHVVSYF